MEEGGALDTSSGVTETPSTGSTRKPFKPDAAMKGVKAAVETRWTTTLNKIGTDATKAGKKIETGWAAAAREVAKRVH